MNTSVTSRTATAELDALIAIPSPPLRSHVYAISFDLDREVLKVSYSALSHQNATAQITRILFDEGFEDIHGAVYFGGERITAVTCVLAAQRLARELEWFSASVRDIRMLRIEDNNDLGPAIRASSSPR